MRVLLSLSLSLMTVTALTASAVANEGPAADVAATQQAPAQQAAEQTVQQNAQPATLPATEPQQAAGNTEPQATTQPGPTANPVTATIQGATGQGAVGYVQEQVQLAKPPSLQEAVRVSTSPTELREYSSRKYQAVRFTVTNAGVDHVEILQAEVPGALNEQALAQQKAESSQKKSRAFGVLLGGATSVVPFLGAAGNISAGAYRAAVYGQNIAMSAANALEQTAGGQAITGQYIQRVNNVIVSPSQTFTFEAVVPKEMQPQLKMILKNLASNQIVDLVK